MYKATRNIYQELQKDSALKVFIEEDGNAGIVWLQFGIKNGGSYRIRFISKDDDNAVAVRVFGLLKIDDSHTNKLLPILNQLNCKYRYVKFVLDQEGDINVEYDYLLCCPNPAASAKEIVIRIVQIINESYPELMRAMWG